MIRRGDILVVDRAVAAPVTPGLWLGWGVTAQLVGVALPVTHLAVTAHRLSVTGHITGASVRLAWRAEAHSGIGLVLLVLEVALFVFGCMLAARPFVKSRLTWLVAVPFAATIAVLGLGVLAILIAGLVEGGLGWTDYFDPGLGARGKTARQHSR
jgi:hypothetical protein